MNEDQLKAFALSIGSSKLVRRNEWVMGCCPVHGERTPSWGMHIDPPHRTSCFSCKDQQISIAHLLAQMNKIPLKQAREIVHDKTAGEFQLPRNKQIARYEEDKNTRFFFDRVYLAPFRSGKETHDYFFDRGFTVQTAIKFNIGFDHSQSRITVPVMYHDDVVCGVIGRTVLPDVEPRYTFYDNFPKSTLLFPLNKVNMKKRWYIVVEGTFDCMWMHQLGFTNTVAIMGSSMSSAQANWLAQHAEYVVSFLDNDDAGMSGNAYGQKKLVKLMKQRNIPIYTVEYPTKKSKKYPEGRNDPMELTKKHIRRMLNAKKSWYVKKIDRLS